MRSVGIAATAAAVTLAAVAFVLGMRSIPDVKRYLKMRSM